MRCGFCASDIGDDILVCPVCSRDATIPPALLTERNQLLAARDRLAAELDAARQQLAARAPRR